MLCVVSSLTLRQFVSQSEESHLCTAKLHVRMTSQLASRNCQFANNLQLFVAIIKREMRKITRIVQPRKNHRLSEFSREQCAFPRYRYVCRLTPCYYHYYSTFFLHIYKRDERECCQGWHISADAPELLPNQSFRLMAVRVLT